MTSALFENPRLQETVYRSLPRPGLSLERRPDGQLWASQEGRESPVWVRRCFPWSEAAQFVSLRDFEDEEFALVRNAAELDLESRQALESALLEAGFILKVTRVLDVEEEVEIRHWKVETEQGHRLFQTRLDDWPRQVPGQGVLIRDVAGDLFHIAAPERLDKKSRDLLWAFVD